MALQMNVSGLRRNIKNIAHNYTDAQVKVREATSNDPWGPSSTIMSEIADLTYNVVAFTEIMQMIWKRLNDHGRNWRHVYKALVLLEYLIKTGSEKVSEQCKENIFKIETLKNFQFLEENKDMGMNVREKTKALVSLLKDEERLLNERVRALKAKERFAQTVSGIGSETDLNSPSSPTYGDTYGTNSSRPDRNSFGAAERPISANEFENARPQTIGEEELQLQLALAMSKEEADEEAAKKKSDDVRLQMALSQSEIEIRDRQLKKKDKALNDLLDINFNANGSPRNSATPLSPPSSVSNSVVDPWGVPVAPTVTTPPVSEKHDPWGLPAPPANTPSPRIASPSEDPWLPATTQLEAIAVADDLQESSDPWAPVKHKVQSSDPWEPLSEPSDKLDPFAPLKPTCHSSNNIDEFEVLSSRDKNYGNGSEPMNICEIERSVGFGNEDPKSKSPAAFLGENSNLVNLDNLVSVKNQSLKGTQVAAVDKNDNALGSTMFDYKTEWTAPPNNNTAATTPSSSSNNPFMATAFDAPSSSLVAGAVNPFSGPAAPNPFQAQQAPKPTMNQLKTMTGTTFASVEQSQAQWNPPAVESSCNNWDDPFSL